MGRPKQTELEKEAFREALLDTALGLFSEQGYEAMSMRSLAAAMHCSPMTPYRYFKDKAAIFDACRSRAFQAFAREQRAVADSVANPGERIGALGQAYAGHAQKHPEAFRLMFELDQPDTVSKELRQAERQAFNTIAQAVSESVDAGYLEGDANTLAHLYWATLHGIVMLNSSNRLVHGRSSKTLLKALFDGGFSRLQR